MTELITLPYASRLVIGFLIEQPELTDDLNVPARNIGTDIAHDVFPSIEITQFPGRIIESGSVYWLEQTLMQLSVHGPGGNDRFMAHTIAETARALLAQRLSGAVDFTIGSVPISGVVSSVACGGIHDETDGSYTPARPWSHFDVVLTAHPLPHSGS